MTAVITAIGDFITATVSWIGTLIGTVTAEGNEILLLFVVVLPVIAFIISLVRRFTSF